MTNNFIETYTKPKSSNVKKDEDGYIIVGENIQVILESTITSIEE